MMIKNHDVIRVEDRIALANDISRVVYGKNFTAEMRQAYLMEFGCSSWTSEAIDLLQRLGEGKGFIEIGAGNGNYTE